MAQFTSETAGSGGDVTLRAGAGGAPGKVNLEAGGKRLVLNADDLGIITSIIRWHKVKRFGLKQALCFTFYGGTTIAAVWATVTKLIPMIEEGGVF